MCVEKKFDTRSLFFFVTLFVCLFLSQCLSDVEGIKNRTLPTKEHEKKRKKVLSAKTEIQLKTNERAKDKSKAKRFFFLFLSAIESNGKSDFLYKYINLSVKSKQSIKNEDVTFSLSSFFLLRQLLF